MNWQGMIPAITTAFNQNLDVDFGQILGQSQWLVQQGADGIVTPGSLGEANTLSFEEKVKLWQTLCKGLGHQVPIVAAISAFSTQDAIQQAKAAKESGCQALMILPPYVYRGDQKEVCHYFESIICATDLSCMIYNNPGAYGTDLSPEMITDLGRRFHNVNAVKESSGDVRRITALKVLNPHQLTLFVGLDDYVMEGVQAGAQGWIAGVACAFPKACKRLFELSSKDVQAARELYAVLLPLLRMDTVPKFVQLIKLMQAEAGMGHERVRPPRLELTGQEREFALAEIKKCQGTLREMNLAN